MKKVGFILMGLLMSSVMFAQKQKPNYGATPEDSVKCISSLIYKDYMKSDPKLAMELWRTACEVCPASQKSLYINGSKLYQGLIKKEKDSTQRELLVDSVLMIYDLRMQHFGQRGYVLGLQGQMMLKYRSTEYEKIAATLDESISLKGNKTQPGVLVGVMYNMVNMEKNGVRTKADVVGKYSEMMTICAANVEGKNADKYAGAEEKISNVTAAYLDCDVLVPLAEKDFESNKENIDWLKRTVTLMKRKKCFDAPIFVKVAEAFFNIEPSAAGADAIGKVFWKNKEYSKAVDFFKKAMEMSEKEEEKAEYAFSIAETYLSSGQYASARTYALKAAGLKSGWGEPYMLIGDCYQQSSKTCDDGKLGKYGSYWAAVDKYAKAKAVDASVASKANKKIAKTSAYYPSTKDVFFYNKAKGDNYDVGCWINESTTIRTK